MKNPTRILFLLVCAALPLSCAIVGGPTDLERARGYQVAAPEGWKTLKRGESDRAFQTGSGNVVSIVSSCNRNPDAPLDVLTRHLLMGTRHVKVENREKVNVGGNEGLRTKVLARLEGKPFHLELFVLVKNKCVFDFSLISPKEIPEAESKEFSQLIASFEYGKD